MEASAADTGVKKEPGRSRVTMAGGDLLFVSHGYLGAIVRRRA
jgi:hypothetical protein